MNTSWVARSDDDVWTCLISKDFRLKLRSQKHSIKFHALTFTTLKSNPKIVKTPSNTLKLWSSQRMISLTLSGTSREFINKSCSRHSRDSSLGTFRFCFSGVRKAKHLRQLSRDTIIHCCSAASTEFPLQTYVGVRTKMTGKGEWISEVPRTGRQQLN